MKKIDIDVIFGFLGVFWGFAFGEMSGILTALLVLMVLDYITGISLGALRHNLSSATGYAGIVKKVSILILVMIGNILDRNVLGGGSSVRDMVIFFFIANESMSIIENIGGLGVPIPEKLKDIIEELKEKEDS